MATLLRHLPRVVRINALLALMACLSPPAHASPRGEWTDDLDVAGANGEVLALASHGDQLMVGGSFTGIDGRPFAHVAAWDGSEWRVLGEGLSGSVLQLVSVGELLFARGAFQEVNGVESPGLAVWNGDRWDVPDSLSGSVTAIGLHEGKLHVAGNLRLPHVDTNLLRWEGGHWVPASNGLVTRGQFRITAIGSFRGALYLGVPHGCLDGKPTNVIKFENGEWAPSLDRTGTCGPQFPAISAIHAFTEFDGRLLTAGADLYEFPGWIGAWDGKQWVPASTGLQWTTNSRWRDHVSVLTVWQGRLIAGGQFEIESAPGRYSLAWRDGEVWRPLPGAELPRGHDITVPIEGQLPRVQSLTTYAGELVVGGKVRSIGGTAARNLARYDGGATRLFGDDPARGVDGTVRALLPSATGWIAGGAFMVAGTTPVRNVASWNHGTWSAMGDGLDGDLFTLIEWNGAPHAGGRFWDTDHTHFSIAARWNGSSWEPRGPRLPAELWNETVALALVDHGGLLVGGGSFQSPDHPELTVGAVDIRVDGWRPLTEVDESQPWGSVSALFSDGDTLYAAGYFTNLQAIQVAAWTQNRWLLVGRGLPDGYDTQQAWGLASWNGLLVVATSSVTWLREPKSFVWRWNAGSWQRLGDSIDGNARVLLVYGGHLLVGGRFPAEGNPPGRVRGLVCWQSNSWCTFDGESMLGEPAYSIYAAATHESDLVAGGFFSSIGDQPSLNLARWTAAPLAPNLTSASVTLEGSGVMVRWQLPELAGIQQFRIERRRTDVVAEVWRDSLTADEERHDYEVLDASAPRPSILEYRVTAVDPWGDETELFAETIDLPPPVDAAMGAITIQRLKPQPADRAVSIRFGLPVRSEIKWRLLDVAGRVRVRERGVSDAGWHDREFALTDADGRMMPAGIYWLELDTGREVARRRVVVAR